MSQSGMNH